MKPEKEFIFLVKLAISDYCGGILRKPNIGCKKDYERFLEASENDNNFLEWINKLIEENILISSGEIQKGRNGKTVPAYSVHFNNLLKKLKKNIYYPSACDFFDKTFSLVIK